MVRETEALLADQIAYYRARASEYDQWFLRQGRYDRGPQANRQWFAEVDRLERALITFGAAGQVLELAGGTGIWTQRLAARADRLTVLDSSPEALAINRSRVNRANVKYVETDLFSRRPSGCYDVVFFAFWLSHVPPVRFDAFWKQVRACLAPGGRVFFIDSLFNNRSTAADHRLEGHESTTVTRRLNDGREFRIVKVFYRPPELTQRLRNLKWTVIVQTTGRFFLYGSGEPNE